jgi:uncharacterized protein (DUF924 family)
MSVNSYHLIHHVAGGTFFLVTAARASKAGTRRRNDPMNARRVSPVAPTTVVDFWRRAGQKLWFAKEPEFDRRFRDEFLLLHLDAAHGALSGFLETPEGALALCLLLDQFPRNAFRGTPRMYATDELARSVADAAVRAEHDRFLEPELALFVYLPFGHSERLDDQDRSVELSRRLGGDYLAHAVNHRAIIERFGRFPHRNPILGRPMRADEQRFLDEGGFAG